MASRDPAERQKVLSELTDAECDELLNDWRFWARPQQIAPEGKWSTWLALAGRGWGKTEAGANWIKEREAGGARSIALVAETRKDLEEVMVPRILGLYPTSEKPYVTFGPVRMVWPSGAVAYGYNGNEPDQLRGPEFDTAWVDELAKYRKTRAKDYALETWNMLQFTMRRPDPRVFVTTTPRPVPVLKKIIANKRTVITKGSTFDNAQNLDPEFLASILEQHQGTRLGRQELEGEILDDVPGALWTRESFDPKPDAKDWQGKQRIGRVQEPPKLRRVVVAVDPSGTRGDEDEGDDIGIVIAGLGIDGRGYVLADWTCKLSPDGWGKRAVEAYREFEADRIVAERNFGGSMVEHVIRTVDKKASYKEVTASRGKTVRAEPVAALYEQGRISHVGDGLADLEDQMCLFGPTGYLGEGSPDRVDALVWAITELMLGESAEPPMMLLRKRS